MPLSFSIMSSISTTRSEIRVHRRALSSREQSLHSRAVCRHLAGWIPFLRASSVAVYFSSDGEVDLSPLIEQAWSTGKRLFLPMLHPFAGNRLWFGEWKPGQGLANNRYAIPEPDPRVSTPTHGLQLDMVLVPLLAFDADGNRLGMGGGFYDRTFAFRMRNERWRRPLLIGIAHELQRLHKVHKNPWDVPLDAVITEQGCYGGMM